MALFSFVVIAGEKSWWCSLESVVRPAIDLASVASLASSGAIGKNFVRALAFSVIPTSPPDTFNEGFRCSRALSPLTAQNGTSWFLFTTQLPLVNYSYKRGSVSFRDAISAR